MSKEEKVKIELQKLEEIAAYYEFPLAVFFSPSPLPKGKTRLEELGRKAELLDEIKELIGNEIRKEKGDEQK